jgi:hypothetical protein
MPSILHFEIKIEYIDGGVQVIKSMSFYTKLGQNHISHRSCVFGTVSPMHPNYTILWKLTRHLIDSFIYIRRKNI